MRIVHLSDFHLDKVNQKRSEDLVYFLCQSLKIVDKERKVDLVLFTGDAVNKGGKSFNSVLTGLQEFEKIFIEPVLNTLNLPKERFVFTIGNHDIDRDADTSYSEDGLKRNLVNKAALERFWDNPRSSKDMERVNDYKSFEKDFYFNYHRKEDVEITRFQTNVKIQVADKIIGITCLNSAWRCYDSDEDQGRILIGERQISDSLRFIDKCDLKIAISHHHYSWVKSFEMVNIERLITTNYSMYLCGHTHSPGASCYIRPEGVSFVFVAPGILSSNINEDSKDYKNGFGVIDYDEGPGKIDSRIYFQENAKDFIIDKTFAKDGIWSNDIPLGVEAQHKKDLQNVILNIKEQTESLNEHLLSYHTETKAPKSLTEMFVMPKLTLYIKDEKSDDIKNENINDLRYFIDSDDNYVIFGTKESGKTILLDKLLTLFIETYPEKEILPVKVDFHELKSSIGSAFKEFLLSRKAEAEKIMGKESIVLLVDNIELDDENSKILALFSKYLKNRKNIRFIATCRVNFNHELFFNRNYTHLFKFRRIEIGQMGAKEMMELSQKWNNNQNPIQRKQDLAKAFMHLNIPRTPFSVSMFLWVLERQSGFKPQNVSLLIDMYIEMLLKSGDLNEDSGEKEFDYKHKKSLLAYIANGMLESKEPNLSFLHSKVLGLVEDYLVKLEFKKIYSATDILNSFIKLGILVNENGFLRFRFRCFFEFFLAIWMDEDENFMEIVKSDLLKYHQIVQYYTGLYRGKKNLLKYVFDKLNENFDDVNKSVESELKDLDACFKVNRSIVAELSKNDPGKLMAPKLSEEEINDQTDLTLSLKDKHSSQIEIKKENSLSEYDSHSRYLVMAMNVLKNLESIREDGWKFNYYKVILKDVICHALYTKKVIEEKIKNEQNAEERLDELNFFMRFFPAIYSETLSQNLGSFKMSEIIEKKINLDNTSKETVSEFERFLSVFLFYDVNAKGRASILRDFIAGFKQQYMADACYIQLMKYYMSSESAEDDLLYVDLLADLIIKMTPTDSPSSFRSMSTKRVNDIRKQNIKKMLEKNKRIGLGFDLKKLLDN